MSKFTIYKKGREKWKKIQGKAQTQENKLWLRGTHIPPHTHTERKRRGEKLRISRGEKSQKQRKKIIIENEMVTKSTKTYKVALQVH